MATETSYSTLIRVAKECTAQARLLAPQLTSTADLNTHNTLIATACQALADTLQNGSLPISQDIEASTMLAELLLSDTASPDLAETYLSALRTRLQQYMPGGPRPDSTYFNEWLYVEFLALYEVPRHGSTTLGIRAAINNCTQLVSYLEAMTEAPVYWRYVFMWVQAGLCVQAGRRTNATAIYKQLWQLVESDETCGGQWRAFVAAQYTAWLIESRQEVPEFLVEVLDHVPESTSAYSAQLQVLVLVVRLVVALHRDENITPLLSRFKALFDEHKSSLQDGTEPLVLPLGEDPLAPQIVLTHPALFNYTSLKTLLLFLQSVSYLVNCYDDAANFSVRFLSKVKRNVKKVLQGAGKSDAPCHLTTRDATMAWHTKLLELTRLYQGWESLLLTGQLGDALAASLESPSTEETRLLAQLNEYLALAGKIDELTEGNTDDDSVTEQVLLVRAEQMWAGIEAALAASPLLRTNAMWDCTVVVVWFMTHQEPFTSRPLPSSDATRSEYMRRLSQYYDANRLVKRPAEDKPTASGSGSSSPHTLKKAVWLLALVNYLGGRLLETDLEEIYAVSSACLQVTKGRRLAAPYIRYVLTLWHLLNCTVSMRSREVILTRGRLEALLRGMRGDAEAQDADSSAA